MATNTEGDQSWAEGLVTRVGQAARQIRGRRSARWLSEETERLGYRISPQVIARMDTDRRGDHLEVAELVVLARALRVPPLLLLYPDLPDGQVEELPGVTSRSVDAARHFIGDVSVTERVKREDAPIAELMTMALEMAATARRLEASQEAHAIATATHHRLSAAEPLDEDEIRAVDAFRNEELHRIDSLRRELSLLIRAIESLKQELEP